MQLCRNKRSGQLVAIKFLERVSHAQPLALLRHCRDDRHVCVILSLYTFCICHKGAKLGLLNLHRAGLPLTLVRL